MAIGNFSTSFAIKRAIIFAQKVYAGGPLC